MSEKKQLFPVFEMPKIVNFEPSEEKKYKASLYFDFEQGDFCRDGAGKLLTCEGKEAWKQWCIKAVLTERFTCLAYSHDFGAEMYGALAQSDKEAVESGIRTTIIETLKVNPRTEYVRGFQFFWTGEGIEVNFTVKGKEWEEQQVSLNLSR